MDLPQNTEADVGDIWCCPLCKGALSQGEEAVDCRACGRHFPVIGGVPDLRVAAFCSFDLAEDQRRVAAFATDIDGLDMAGALRRIYGRRAGWSGQNVELRVGQLMQAPDFLATEITGWLREIVFQDQPFLDLGCANGILLAAAARHGRMGVGVDRSLEQLVLAHRRITDSGGSPTLAAACGEALPLRDGSLGSVSGLDVIEHVSDVGRVLAEADRVLRPGGTLVLTTPNRFSLTPEPHVYVWGVGWLPRRWQKPYVKWRSGLPYMNTELMSSWRLVAMVLQHTSLDLRIAIPPVRDVNTQRSKLRARLVPIYNWLAKRRIMRPIFLLCGPFFRLWGHKPDANAARAVSENTG